MGEEDRTRLAAALHTSLAERRGLSDGERKYARWLIDDFAQFGHPHAASMLADQPYVIGFWKPEYLAHLAIKPGRQPEQVPVTLRGHFVESSRGVLMPEVLEQLKAHGVDGVFVKGGMAGYPQLVVWNPKAVVGFGSTKLTPELLEPVPNQPARPGLPRHGSPRESEQIGVDLEAKSVQLSEHRRAEFAEPGIHVGVDQNASRQAAEIAEPRTTDAPGFDM